MRRALATEADDEGGEALSGATGSSCLLFAATGGIRRGFTAGADERARPLPAHCHTGAGFGGDALDYCREATGSSCPLIAAVGGILGGFIAGVVGCARPLPAHCHRRWD